MLGQFLKSIWLFPAILTLILIFFTAFRISGTSVGTYRQILYGDQAKDPALLIGQPEPIRSDEWLVGTQMTVAQAKVDYPRINPNIGGGEDVSIMNDVPYKEWSAIFRPQNLLFFVIPLENAFALKWWLIGYLLIISSYFFILTLLPGRKLLAIFLSTALFFSAFVQWWYLYGTLGPLYYTFFIAIAVMYLCRLKQRWKKLALSAVLAYLFVCFALVLYPPFQIPAGLVLSAFTAGYLIQNYSKLGRRQTIQNLLYILGAGLVAIMVVAAFIFTRLDVVKTINSTAYPGIRSIQSGGFHLDHFLASQLGHQFLSRENTAGYLIDDKSASNQSETSNFLLIIPFLLVPALLLVYREYRHKQSIDWPLLILCLLFIVFLFEIFMPSFTQVSKLLLLNKVGAYRLLIGVGILNILMFVLVVRNLSKNKFFFPRKLLIVYSLLVLAVQLWVSLHASSFDSFISMKGVILFSLPIPLIVYLLLSKRYVLAAFTYMMFSIFIALGVNPLYRGLSTLTRDPLITAIETIGAKSNKTWIASGGYLENTAIMSGEKSLSGVYAYPQIGLWSDIPGVPKLIYNRYAHVGFEISDDKASPTTLNLVTPGSFVVKTYGCSDFLRKKDVGFLITTAVLGGPCTKLEKTIPYPLTTIYIYKLVI